MPEHALETYITHESHDHRSLETGIIFEFNRYAKLLSIKAYQSGVYTLNAILTKNFDCKLPPCGHSCRFQTEASIAWAALNQWYVLCEHDCLSEQLTLLGQLTRNYVSMVDKSNGLVAMRVSGKNVYEFFAKICVLDLQAESFPVNTSLPTKIGYTDIHLRCIDCNKFECLIPRSYAFSVWQWMAHSASEFGYKVIKS